MRRKVSGLDMRMVQISAELLGFHLGKTDYCSAGLTAAIAGALMWVTTAGHVGILSALLAAVFACGLFLVFRRLLPMFLQMNAADILRYRYAFLMVCSASVLAISLTSAFRLQFAQPSMALFSRLLALAAVLSVVRFFTRGERLWLQGAFLLAGLSFLSGVAGPLALLLIWLTFALVHYAVSRIVCAYPMADCVCTAERAEVRSVLSRFAVVVRLRVSCALSLLAGFAIAMVLRYIQLGGGSHSAFLKGTLRHYGSAISGLTVGNSGVILAIAFAAVVMALVFARRATDVEHPLTNGLLLLYVSLFALSLLFLSGLAMRVPLFRADLALSAFLLPQLLFSCVLVLSGVVILIELSCRGEVLVLGDEDVEIPDPVGFRAWCRRRALVFTVSLYTAVFALAWYGWAR